MHGRNCLWLFRTSTDSLVERVIILEAFHAFMFCHSTSEHILRLHQTLLLLVATVVPGVAQVTVDQSLSMEEYVGLLLGEGVTAFQH